MLNFRTSSGGHRQPSENNSNYTILEGKNQNEKHQETINALITQFQSLAPLAKTPQLPDLARAISLNNTKVSFLLEIIALLTQLIRLKTLLHSEILEDLFLRIGEQAFNNLVHLANKALVYRIQYPVRTNNINFLLQKITAHATALTASINTLNGSDKPEADAILLLGQSKKCLEQALESYTKNLPLIMTRQGRENLAKRRITFFCGIAILALASLSFLTPFNILMIMNIALFVGISLCLFSLTYQAHKIVKNEQKSQQRNYQNSFSLKPQKDTLEHLKEVQKLKAGKDLLRNNKLDKALRCFSQISENSKAAYTQAMYEYGNALLVREQYPQAIHYFTKAGDLESAQQAANFQLLAQVEAAEENPNKQQLPPLLARFFNRSTASDLTRTSNPSTHSTRSLARGKGA